MHENRALRYCMQAMVILNLALVQMTGAAGLQWLVPLYVLAFAAPLLTRFHNSFAYRLLWNGAVLCFFATLLSHALNRSLSYVLEDGLILAVLCQVHLLNNLRSNQRPDLLFFNAFLIATITGFMTRELGFALAFLVFVPFFVIGQQLLTAVRGKRRISGATTRALVFDGAKRSGLLLVLTLLAFLFWPRDFNRKPILKDSFDLVGASQELRVGFNEKLELNRKGKVKASNRPTLRVTLLEGSTADVPALWRGATLGSTTGGTWQPSKPTARNPGGDFDERWQRDRLGLVRKTPGPEVKARVAVERLPQDSERLFMPLSANELRMDPRSVLAVVHPRHDGTIGCVESGQVLYELGLAESSPGQLGGQVPATLPASLADYVELPQVRRIELARKLARELSLRAPAGEQQFELVERIRAHLARTYRYLPPGSDGAASTLEEFLVGTSGGHCEFFASALATMLRSLNVPCRVVTGYRSSNWDSEGKVLAFGELNAHAWVEVLDPSGGWYSVDASPTQIESLARTSRWAQLTALARKVWDTVTDFNAERRGAVVAWGRSLPRRLLRGASTHPLETAGLALTFPLAAVLWGLRPSRRTIPAVRAYGRVLRRCKLKPQPGETPRELLVRAETQQLAPKHLSALRQATQKHERARYAA